MATVGFKGLSIHLVWNRTSEHHLGGDSSIGLTG